VGLEQSPFVKVLPDRKAERILKQMGRSSDERMTGRTAIEVCQRASGKVTVQGSIAEFGYKLSHWIGGDPVRQW